MNKRKEQLDVFLDIDGVIADTEGLFCHRFGYNHRELDSLVGRYPDKAREITAFIQDHSTYHVVLPEFVGIEIARWLMERVVAYERKQTRAHVTLLTSRPIGTMEVTQKWLKNERVPYHQLEFSRDKVHWMREHCPDIIVDDIMDVCMGAAAIPGVTPILVAHPWNETPFIPRITSLQQFQRIYQEVALEKLLDDSGGVRLAEDIPHPS